MFTLTPKIHGEKSEFFYTRILNKYGSENESHIFYFPTEQEMLDAYNDDIHIIEYDDSENLNPEDFDTSEDYHWALEREKYRFENPKWTIEFKNTSGHKHSGMVDL